MSATQSTRFGRGVEHGGQCTERSSEACPAPSESHEPSGAVAKRKSVVTLVAHGFRGRHGLRRRRPDDEDGDGPDDEPTTAARSPHPLDRIWLHPSELSPLADGHGHAAPGSRCGPRRSLAGAAGAILTLAVLGAVGALGDSSDGNDRTRTVPTSVPIMTAQALAVAVAHSVVAVSALDEDGPSAAVPACAYASRARSSRATGSSVRPTK